MNIWIALAVLVIAVLAIYAIYLYIKLYKVNVERKQKLALLEQELKERQAYCRKSIQIIANALLSENEEITLTEAAIRISVLSGQLNLSEEERAGYQVFAQLAEATGHIPILDEWKKLKTPEKLRFDREREEIEQKYRDFVLQAARNIVSNTPADNLFYQVGQ